MDALQTSTHENTALASSPCSHDTITSGTSKHTVIPADMPEDEVVTKIRDILLDFIHRSGFANVFSPTSVPSSLRDSFYDLAKSYDLDFTSDSLKHYNTVGLTFAVTGFRHTPPDVQVVIALFTALCVIIDDDFISPSLIREFPERLFNGHTQLHPALTCYAKVIAGMRKHYSPYSASVIATNSVEFVSSEMLARDEAQGVPDEAPVGYADYIRLKNGVGEAYTALIWPREMFPHTKVYVQVFPYVNRYICYANDLYSFYKEYKAGETDNYLSQLAVARNQAILEVVRNIAEEIIALDLMIRKNLGDRAEREAWESFAKGYLGFHLHSPRYRLEELFPQLN